MSKPHRGKSIRDLPFQGRGTCPICNKNGVKILYEQDAGGEKIKICKICRAAVKNGKKSLPAASAAEAPAAAPASASTPAAAETVAAPAEVTDASEVAETTEAAEVIEEAETTETAEA